jgi:hypothetical protein
LGPSSFSWKVRLGEGRLGIAAGIAVGMVVGIAVVTVAMLSEEEAISNEEECRIDFGREPNEALIP